MAIYACYLTPTQERSSSMALYGCYLTPNQERSSSLRLYAHCNQLPGLSLSTVGTDRYGEIRTHAQVMQQSSVHAITWDFTKKSLALF